jgi:hypothetical protein
VTGAPEPRTRTSRIYGRTLLALLVLLLGSLLVTFLVIQRRKWIDVVGIGLESHDGREVRCPLGVVRDAATGRVVFRSKSLGSRLVVPPEHRGDDRILAATGPGCGIYEGPFPAWTSIALPPAIRVEFVVPGDHALPAGEQGLRLTFGPVDEDDPLGSLLSHAAAPQDDGEDFPGPFDRPAIWIDPASRTARVLLPRAGPWMVRWSRTDRNEDGTMPSLSILWASGSQRIDVREDGQRLELSISPEQLEPEVD